MTQAEEASLVTRFTLDLSIGSGAALAFQCWDTLITFDREVDDIWTKPNSSWLKWAFLFARYFPLLAQITGRVIDMSILYQKSLLLNKSFIRGWYISQVLVAWLTILGAEIVMMSRVYAMYNRNRWLGIGFISLLVMETVTVFLGLGLTLPASDFDPLMLITTTSHSFVFFGISAMVAQIIILALSVIRYVRGEWNGIPIIKLMIRDGTLAFGVLFFVSLLLVVYTLLDTNWAATTYAWLITFVSVVECRLILNMQRIPLIGADGISTSSDGPPLTTFIEDHRGLSHLSTIHEA
ncbi:hypothetical protein BDZ89DRAFT_1063008 [Hymenopellis radicata]|nr:hypothetical protein BDZ89DRAFT_1063008 [Hymenopellis radicata]